MSEAAAEAVVAVAVVALELDEGLAVGGVVHADAALLPLSEDEVALGG